MKKIDRLVKLACYYNRIKNIEFYRHYDNKRIADARGVVYFIALNDLNFTLYELSIHFKKTENYILEILKHHKSEYNIIHHYTQIYHNVITQFNKWKEVDLDLQYCITKTKYDYDTEKRYEQILNENGMLKHQVSKLKIKLNKNKNYV
tara:strand:+ start:5201 stop:5644 length:444 start_codon:yes stop_codon:yes gene_type:complete